MEVEYLLKNYFDHAPMLLRYSNTTEDIKKPFKFFKFSSKGGLIFGCVRQH